MQQTVSRSLTRRIYPPFPIRSTKGTEVEYADQIFNGFCDWEFLSSQVQCPTLPMSVALEVLETEKEATPFQVLEAKMRLKPGRPRFFTFSQMVVFCEDLLGFLRPQGCGTLFPIAPLCFYHVVRIETVQGGPRLYAHLRGEEFIFKTKLRANEGFVMVLPQ